MAEFRYAFKDTGEHMTKAVGINLPISLKQSVMICKSVRGKMIDKAVAVLDSAIKLDRPIPFTRYNKSMGHKKGKMAAGRFVPKACGEIKKLIVSAQTNGQAKGLSTSGLKLIHICAKKGTSTYRYGRHSRRSAKRTTVEVVLEEVAKEEKKAKKPVVEKKETPVAEKQVEPAPKVENATVKPAPAEKKAEPAPKVKSAPAKTVPAEKPEEKPSPSPKKEAEPEKKEQPKDNKGASA
ncbi:MAG: 50S ribosomal protein L22 [archaeon]